MACSYSTYIVVYAISSPLLGRYIDRVSNVNAGDMHSAIYIVGGVHFTILPGIMLIATFIPKGAFSLGPKSLYGETLQSDSRDELAGEVPVKGDKRAVNGL